MSDEITEKDTILVPEGSTYRAWHGKEKPVGESITIGDVREHGLHPRIVEGTVTAAIGDQQVTLKDYKSLVAITNKGEMHPLHISGQRYSIIQNEDVWNTMSTAFQGVDIPYKLTCVGTLSGLRRYFISVAIGDGNGFEVNGDQFHGNINFLTGHNGMAFRAHDSLYRVVCGNTFINSLGGQKNLDFKVYHKGNATAHCEKLGEYLNAVLQGRVVFTEAMERLAAIQVADTDIEAVVGGYFLNKAFERGEKLERFSTRTLNQVQGISDLTRHARHGLGNSGRTMYDVFNGATQYYTSGDGVGKTTSVGRKAYSSEFGTGSERKQEFSRYLIKGQYNTAADEARAVLMAN
jgi:hypothetical protein